MILGNRVSQIVWRNRADLSLRGELAFRIENTWFLVDQENQPVMLRAIRANLSWPESNGYELPAEFTSRKVVGLKRGDNVLVEEKVLLELEDRFHIGFGFEWSPWDEVTYAQVFLCDPNDPEFSEDFWTDVDQLPRVPEGELVTLT